jgi:hypothetical protein
VDPYPALRGLCREAGRAMSGENQKRENGGLSGPSLSYEAWVRAGAARQGWVVVRDRDGLLVTDDDGRSAWHRLGGRSEELFERRHREGGRFLEPGRWVDAGGRLEWLPLGSRLTQGFTSFGRLAITLPPEARRLPKLPPVAVHPRQLRFPLSGEVAF